MDRWITCECTLRKNIAAPARQNLRVGVFDGETMIDDGMRAETDPARNTYVRGVVLLILGAIAFSSAGLFVRLIGRDAATILFWRGLFTVLAVLTFLLWRHGKAETLRQFLGMGRPDLAVALCQVASMACFISSLQFTTVANNSIIFGISPFLTAGLAWLMIRERPSVETMLLSLVALGGALLVVGNTFMLSRAGLAGDGLAVLMTLFVSVKTVLLRKHVGRSMIPANCFGAVLGSLGAAPFVADWTISQRELVLFALFGFTQQGAGLILTTIGTPYVPAAHAALLLSLDLPLAPAWVWLLFGERPTAMGLIGGLIVLAAILAHIVIEGRRQT